MSAKVTFDHSRAAAFVRGDEVAMMEAQTCAAAKILTEKTGAGNDFLGWIDLPVDYDKDEFARIKKAAAQIQAENWKTYAETLIGELEKAAERRDAHRMTGLFLNAFDNQMRLIWA